jgi:ribosomal protein uS2
MVENKMLVELDEYINCGVHLGNKNSNAYSKTYIQGHRNDGIKIIDMEKINSKLNVLLNVLERTDSEKIMVVGKRDNTKKAIKLFSELTGCKSNAKRYLPGKLTNIELDDFSEYKIIIVCDPYFDKNILNEAFSKGIFIVALCNTNNVYNKVDLVVPLNNMGKKSVGLAFMILAKNLMVRKNLIKDKDFKYTIEDFSIE